MTQAILKNLFDAAEQGDCSAQTRLGFSYWFGEGVPQDLGLAEKWLQKCAEQGDASGQYNLGCFYYSALGSPLNSIEVVYWWREAAERGFAPPCPATPPPYPCQTIYADKFFQITRGSASFNQGPV